MLAMFHTSEAQTAAHRPASHKPHAGRHAKHPKKS
jgi:hypothetical protein